MSDRIPSPRKPIFDTLRTIMQRGFRQREVDVIDGAIDGAIERALERAGVPHAGLCDEAQPFGEDSSQNTVSPVSGVPYIRRTDRSAPHHNQPAQTAAPTSIGASGIALIKQFEGCARLRRDGLVEAYPDPGTGAEPWTIGWGATRGGLHGFVGRDTVWTQAQCDERLAQDLRRYASDVARAIGNTPTTQAQFDAMVSFHYNTGAIARATLTRRHIARDYEGAAEEFRRWNMAGGRVLKGLVRRRAAEERLYRDR